MRQGGTAALPFYKYTSPMARTLILQICCLQFGIYEDSATAFFASIKVKGLQIRMVSQGRESKHVFIWFDGVWF